MFLFHVIKGDLTQNSFIKCKIKVLLIQAANIEIPKHCFMIHYFSKYNFLFILKAFVTTDNAFYNNTLILFLLNLDLAETL